jgi:predicted benzoate:H+ symporter BenE
MMAAGMIVSLIATTGWLYLNWRALQSDGLSFEQKAGMAVGWALIIGVLTFVLSRLGY